MIVLCVGATGYIIVSEKLVATTQTWHASATVLSYWAIVRGGEL